MHLSMWTIWFVVAIITAIIEMISPTFGFIFVSAASLVACFAAILHVPWFLQAILFCVTVLVCLFLIRPRLHQKFGSVGVPNKIEKLIGQRALVTEAIDLQRGTGRVLVHGEDWAARCLDPISLGSEVVIEGIDGITLLVVFIGEGDKNA